MRVRESELIEKIEEALGSPRNASRELRLGIGDDAALFRARPGHEIVLTCDWFLEGTHFLRGKHPPSSVGWKCLARAVSDIASLGGLRRASREFQCSLAGGDTTRRNKILINVTVIGEIQTGRAALRSGARPGDLVYVSGRLGEAELGLQLLKRSLRGTRPKDPGMKKHLYPEPRLALGQWLAKNQ